MALTNKERNAKNRAKKKLLGICRECSNKVINESTLCELCKEKAIKRRLIKVAKGLCTNCNTPALPGLRMCQYHRDYWKKRNKEKRTLLNATWRKHYNNNKEKFANQDKEKRLLRDFGITKEQWLQIYDYQKGKCAICGAKLKRWLDDDGGKIASLDHGHHKNNSLIRGLLCSMPCNRHLNDNIEQARATLMYLENPPVSMLFGKVIMTAPGSINSKKRRRLLKKQRLLKKLEEMGLNGH
jgi:hypothetical protein